MSRATPLQPKLNEVDQLMLATFWWAWWAAVSINPRGLQKVRAHMVHLGLVEKRGKLKLTKSGERVVRFLESYEALVSKVEADRERIEGQRKRTRR